MNYYPNNYYQNYPYSGAGYTQYSQSLTQPPQPQQQPMPQITQQVSGLQGKIVDGEDVVRATEVPFGGYGIFPKADLGEIYVKTWNNDGTTKVVTYKPTVAQATDNQNIDTQSILLSKMQEIEKKLDAITERYTSTPISQTTEIRKESIANAY